MMDQLASVGVEFDEATITRVFTRLERYYRDMAADGTMIAHAEETPVDTDDPEEVLAQATAAASKPSAPSSQSSWLACFRPAARHWTIEPIYQKNTPVRPWGLGEIQKAAGLFYTLAGHVTRSPNMYYKTDPQTGNPTTAFLEDTNERIHSSVRVRLALEGLGLEDKDKWDAPALRGHWRVKRTTKTFIDPIPATVKTWEPQTEAELAAVMKPLPKAPVIANGPEGQQANGAQGQSSFTISNVMKSLVELATQQQRPLSALDSKETRWVWEYCGPENEAPPQRLIVEEPLGPYERQLLRLSGGSPNVYEVAEGMEVAL